MSPINDEDFLKRIQAGEKIEAADAMPEEYRHALLRLLEAQAIGELSGAYSGMEWIAKAPTIQEKVLMAQIIRDEVRHAGVLYRCLEELGVDVENRVKELDEAYDLIHVESKKPASETEKKNVLRSDDIRRVNIQNFRIETWVECAMVNFCLDRYAAHLLTDAEKSSYNPLVKACQSILKEEAMHISHGDAWVERLAKDPKTRQEVQQALNKWFPRTMHQFEPVDSPENTIYKKWRLMVRDYNDLREDFHKEIKERVACAGLQMPSWK